MSIYVDCDGYRTTVQETAVAKKTCSDGAWTYYVMASAEGRLFNPADGRASLTKKDRERGGLKFTLRRCSEATYEKYVEYLTTRSPANLLVAERKFNNE